jgi:hypothetical protein
VEQVALNRHVSSAMTVLLAYRAAAATAAASFMLELGRNVKGPVGQVDGNAKGFSLTEELYLKSDVEERNLQESM